MKKIITVLLLLSSISHTKMFDVTKFTAKMAGKNINKLAHEVMDSPHLQKNLLQKISLKSTPLDNITILAQSIASKSKFADNLISTTAHPSAVLRQYSKYGDNYLRLLEMVSTKSLTLNKKEMENFKHFFPELPPIQLSKSEIFRDKMVQTLKYTGKKGWETSQKLLDLSKKHPKSASVAILMAWYTTDPESFFEQKEKLIAFVGSSLEEGVSDATKLTLGASSGIADGFISVAKEKMTFSNMLVLFLALIAFVVWKLRFYIKKYVTIKLENKLKDAKNNGGML